MRLCTFRMFLVMVAMTMALPLPVSAESGTPVQTEAVPASAHALPISSGDLLEISVFDTPELSGRLRVNEAGNITIPIAGAVRVSGMTADEAAPAIEERLRSTDIVKNPHVAVFVSQYATQGVTVTGEVRSPGIYPLLGSHGLVDMLTAAGGVTPAAGRVVSVTHNSDPEHPEMIKLDSQPGKIVANVDIRPGDRIVVSKGGIAYIIGDVGKPGAFLIEGNDRLTMLQLIALAGGVTRTAAKDKAHLIRKTPNGREDVPVPLNAIMRGQSVDMRLEDGDILFVPSSKGKIFAYRGVETAVGLTTGLALAGRF